MRKSRSVLLALISLLAVSLAAAAVVTPGQKLRAAYSPQTAKSDGRDIFLKYHCDNCHSVSTAGITAKMKTKAPDLVDVTVRHEKSWIRKYIRLNDVHVSCPKVDKEHDGKKHTGGKFAGTQEEEDSLIEWLDKQRSKK